MTEFSLAYVNALLRRARRAARLPEDAPDGWQTAGTDFNRIVSVFDRLRMKSGYVLRAYTFFEGGNGNGFVYAVPADMPFPDQDNARVTHRTF